MFDEEGYREVIYVDGDNISSSGRVNVPNVIEVPVNGCFTYEAGPDTTLITTPGGGNM